MITCFPGFFSIFRISCFLSFLIINTKVLSQTILPPIYEDLPMVGTDAHGHAYPGASVPFGMTQLSPDTTFLGWDTFSGYHYSSYDFADNITGQTYYTNAMEIDGFSHDHLSGTGGGCLGDVLVMPTVGKVYLNVGSPGNGYASNFSHTQEQATPGYYRVYLETPKVTAELTATARCGFHKYTFPASDQSHIVVDLAHGIGNKPVAVALYVENQNTVSGYRLSNGWGGKRVVYFVMQFSKPFYSFGIQQDGKQIITTNAEGKIIKAFFNYSTTANEAVLVKVGISGTSIEGARKNLAAEIPGWNFNGVRAAAVRQWKKVFDAVQIQTPDPDIQKTFYANLYLTCLGPVLFNDVDGTYVGFDHQSHPNPGFQNYTTFSIWDIYRTEWPLLMLLHPDRIDDMVQSLLKEDSELNQHSLPLWPLWANETWCMSGYHSADMIAAAYQNGFKGFDAEAAYQAMRDTAMQGRNGLDKFNTLGYVPSSHQGQATSVTMEYTVDDWCIARMAQELGHENDAQLFYQRSANYRNLFDRSTEFFRGRIADGTWRMPFDPIGMVNDEYTEADAWQYAFAAQHDIPGMIMLYGGDRGFIQKLDALFNSDSTMHTSIPDVSGRIGQYVGGNEQSTHIAYLYDYAGAPYKTQYWVRQAAARLYNDTPKGEPGNIDCGEMAAWYVFTALGFYPVNPNSNVFMIGSPTVNKVVIHLDRNQYHGRTFTVIAKNNSPDNVYIQSATLNGKPLTRPWLARDEIISGGTLDLQMGAKANPDWGSAQADRPPLTMPANFQYPPLPAPAQN